MVYSISKWNRLTLKNQDNSLVKVYSLPGKNLETGPTILEVGYHADDNIEVKIHAV